MDSNSLDRIKNLIPSLPVKDIELGHRFLEERNFEALKDLVFSAIYKVKRNLKSSSPKEEYLKLDMDSLEQLQCEVLDYYSQFESNEDDDLSEFTNMFLDDGLEEIQIT